MPKRTTSFPLALPLPQGKLPAYRWLYSELRAQILDGRLRPGSRLPSTRDLARLYRLSRGTIVAAFEQLSSEGYLEAIVGSGTRVSGALPEDWLNVAGRRAPSENKKVPAKRHLTSYAKHVRLFPGYKKRPTRAFRSNVPALDVFPIELWTKITARVLRRITTHQLLGCGPMGDEDLRRAIAGYLAAARGVKCRPEQVAVLSGVQEALDLTARLFVAAGDHVCMEAPGYIGAAQVFEAIGAKVAHVDLDQEGMILPARSLRSVRLAYVTPGHHFPLGTTMTLSRRLALLDWANSCTALIFEDDYDGEFRYSGRPIPALQGLDRVGCVLYAGTFSKVLFPSLRLGYLVLPDDLVDRFAAAISLTTRHAPVLDQAVLCEFIEAGHFGRHIRAMRELYAERLAALLQAAHEHLSGLLDISAIEAGLQTVGWLQAGIQETAAVEAAKSRNVNVTPLSAYCARPLARPGLQLGFAAVDPREIRRGARDLARALEPLGRHQS